MHYAIFTWFDNNKCIWHCLLTEDHRSLLYHIVIRCHMLNMVSNKLGHRKYSYHGNELQYDTKVTCDLPLTSNVIYEAVYMVNLDICLPTFEFNDDVIYTLLRKYYFCLYDITDPCLCLAQSRPCISNIICRCSPFLF
jgi:hypothetical protein